MHLPRTERRATSRQARASTLLGNISQVMEEEYNYEDIRNMAVACFAHHYDSNLGNDCGACVAMAARGLGKSTAFVYKWVMDFEANENFFSEYKWGDNTKTPMKLCDVETWKIVTEWVRARNGHQRGRPNLTTSRFKK